MRQLYAMERKLQDIESKLQNINRRGKVFDVKFEKKRWYARMREGEKDSKDKFETGWLPWETHANGAVKISNPPRKGQLVVLNSPNGQAELGSLAPYHNDPENESPHDKPDEFFMRVEKPGEDGKPGSDKNKILDVHYTQDGSTVSIGDTKHGLTKDSQSVTTKNNSVDTETDTTKASKSHSLETKERTVTATRSTIQSTSYAVTGKVLINS
jgi:phage baseplate assembly protein gpV